jgi:hypothetical protein
MISQREISRGQASARLKIRHQIDPKIDEDITQSILVQIA